MDGMERARKLIAEARETRAEFLDLGNLKLTELPAELFELTHLRSLNLGMSYSNDRGEYQLSANGGFEDRNSLNGLPANLSALSNLQALCISHNAVSDLGPLKGLSGLQHLHCWDTQVSDLGPLKGLTALQSVNCPRTQVSDLGSLQGLSGLQSLNCSRTRVSDLGPLHGLSGLQKLDCSSTRVSDLLPLVPLDALAEVTANACRLSNLPRRLVERATLEELTLFESSIPGVPPEVLSPDDYTSCLETLRDHLRDLDAGSETVCEGKLVVLGNGRLGKTQICRYVLGLPYDKDVATTHGITVSEAALPGAPEGGTVNIWDFGGQDIYHGAHTLFMKTSAVFLIAWHPDFESGEQTKDGLTFRNYPLPYWLDYVRTLGRRDSPVMVVQARCERADQEVRRLPADDALLDQFPSLKPCWFSAMTRRGKGALDDALGDAMSTLRERDGIATIGAGRMRVLRKLKAWRKADQDRPREQREHRTLTQIEFRHLCEQAGGVNSPDRLLEYLHNLGVVFYQRELFHERIILDQSWALEAVYGVFDREKAYPLIQGQGGRFTRKLLALTAWRDYTDNEQALFLSLMQSCGIAFVSRESNEKLGLETEYVAPDALPEKDAVSAQIAGRWNDAEESWRLEYEYTFLHAGLMRALLCDVGERSHEAGVYWKYGLWVYEKDSGCRAWIEQQMVDERRGRITLRLQGRRHEALGRWLRERIERRNRLFGYADLKPVVDEWGPMLERDEALTGASHPKAGLKEKSEHKAAGGDAAAEPVFGKPPASFYGPREPQVYVSYAWGDDTPEGRQRGKVVDDLCTVLGQQGIKVLRDRDEMQPGQLISEFMDRLAKGDYIIAVISDKYLRSEYCMYELFRIYRNCADRPELFIGRVIPMILPDAKVGSLPQRLARARYWSDQAKDLEPLVKDNLAAVGNTFYSKVRLIGEFARNTSDMLEHLTDKLQPRDFERQATEGFKEILNQIKPLA